MHNDNAYNVGWNNGYDGHYNNSFEAGTEDYYDYEIGYDDGSSCYKNIGDGWYNNIFEFNMCEI